MYHLWCLTVYRLVTFMRHKCLILTVKKCLKSVYMYGSYRKNKTGIAFLGNPVYSTEYSSSEKARFAQP